MSIQQLTEGKRVLFITTKNIDYIRNTQEIRILKEKAKNVELVYSNSKKYPVRIIEVLFKLLFYSNKKYDVAFVGFAPQLIVPVLGLKFRKKTLIEDFFISVYDTLVMDRKKFSKNSFPAKAFHALDSVTIKKADYVITDTKVHARYFIEEFGANPDIFETIYLEADPTIYYPREQHKDDELKDKYVVLYFGSILPLQGIDVVLGAIRELKENSNIFFEMIGPIDDAYNKPIQDNVRYYNWLSQTDLSERIAKADLCLAGHFSGEIDKAWRTIPGKTYIYEMMQKNIVLGDSAANHELFVEDNRHHFVKMGSSRDLAVKINEIFEGGR